MARIRSVKPELRTSYLVASWPRDIRYFWVLFWGYLDDEGRGLDIPKTIAGDCFPHDDDVDGKQVNEWLDLMTRGAEEEPGPVCRYTVAGKRYVHAVNWHEHQKINRPTPSRLPRCPRHDRLTESVSEPLTESLNGNSVNGAGEQGSRGAGEQRQRAHESRSEYPDAIRGIVIDATGATPEEADRLLDRVKAERQPRSLAPFVRRMAMDGDLKDWLCELRAASHDAEISAAVQAIRDGPICDHGEPGGASLHPASGEPICALCRNRSRLRVVEQEAS